MLLLYAVTPVMPANFSPAVSKAAAEWLTLRMDTGFSLQDAERLQHWRNADPEHERAWQHIEQMSANLQRLNGKAAVQTLSQLPPISRRTTLKAVAWLGLLTGSGLLASRTEQWQLQMADYSTGAGELKKIMLQDGTQVVLNTRSAIDVQLNNTQRIITLLNGEIMVTTGHQPGEQRPFTVATPHGNITPLGTQFNVRLTDTDTQINVLEGTIQITSQNGRQAIVHAAEQTTFTSTAIQSAIATSPQANAWQKGLLFANDMRLADLVQELQRYRPGFIHCDETIADLKISGAFPLQDTTEALDAIPNSLPVKIIYRTRYWVRIASDHAG